MISLRLYFPALGGIRLRMSGRLGSIGRMNPGILSYIAWTPEMISFASFSSILVPLRAVFILLALIFSSNFSRSIYLRHIQVRQVPARICSLDCILKNDLLDGRVQSFLASVKGSSKTLAEALPCLEAIRWHF